MIKITVTTVILRYPCFLYQPEMGIYQYTVRITTFTSFKSLMVAIISAIPAAVWYCLWSTVFLREAGLVVSTSATIALTPQRTKQGFWQLLSTSIPITYSGTRK